MIVEQTFCEDQEEKVVHLRASMNMAETNDTFTKKVGC